MMAVLPAVAWVAWVVAFVVLEGYAIINGRPGDTLSERTRVFFRVQTWAGRLTFAAALVGFTAWFIPHIIGG